MGDFVRSFSMRTDYFRNGVLDGVGGDSVRFLILARRNEQAEGLLAARGVLETAISQVGGLRPTMPDANDWMLCGQSGGS